MLLVFLFGMIISRDNKRKVILNHRRKKNMESCYCYCFTWPPVANADALQSCISPHITCFLYTY